MRNSLKLGRVHGIEIGLHYSWVIVFVLLTVSLALGFFPETFPFLPPVVYWVLGAVAALLLFVSVLIHELSHSFVAQRLGIGVRSITLFIFGGISNIEGEPHSARDELLISAAGPVASVVLGIVFGALLVLVGGANQALAALLSYLALTNILLAIFNLIPGFPLDGGRVFRSIVWGITGSFARATRIASILGQVIAYIFIFGGLLLAFTGAFLSGIWIAIIGWFLNSAAEATRRQLRVQQAFTGVKVSDVMNPEPQTVSPDRSLRDVVDEYVLHRNIRAMPVVDSDGKVVGLVTVAEIKKVPRERWDVATVGEVMLPAAEVVTVSPQANAGDALEIMGQRDINQLPVTEEGHLVGLLSRANALHFLQMREELGSTRP